MQDTGQLYQTEMFISFGLSFIALVVFVWAYARIIQKAGYSGWHVLWVFVPIVNIIMILVFAFAEWPVTRRIKELEARVFGDLPDPTLNRPA
jgi:hypothetical protein